MPWPERVARTELRDFSSYFVLHYCSLFCFTYDTTYFKDGRVNEVTAHDDRWSPVEGSVDYTRGQRITRTANCRHLLADQFTRRSKQIETLICTPRKFCVAFRTFVGI